MPSLFIAKELQCGGKEQFPSRIKCVAGSVHCVNPCASAACRSPGWDQLRLGLLGVLIVHLRQSQRTLHVPPCCLHLVLPLHAAGVKK